MRVVVLGNEYAHDDGGALLASVVLQNEPGVELVRAGRPGVALLDLLEGDRVLLVDVVRSGRVPGTVLVCDLAALVEGLLPSASTSSHGMGPTEVLALGKMLGRALPTGLFVGIEGEDFSMGEGLSARVREAMPALQEALLSAVKKLRE